MPNAVVLEEKKKVVETLADKFSNSVAGVIVNYSGTSVSDDTALRKELREAGVYYTVAKNTLIKRAITGTALEELGGVLEGTTAVAVSESDYTAAARILSNFAEKHPNFEIKGGFLEGKVVDIATVNALAKLPSREVLLATVVAAFQAPIAAFARAVKAVAEKDGEPAAE